MIDFDVLIGLTEPAAGEGIERIGVGIVVRGASGRILAIRRAPHDGLPGLWEHPGGGRTSGSAA
ncbi:NUDIX domain-containing protein [Kitasatospora purpeofusca]|uniref:NUDIX domain-containing protein n=1 Tax=Kitasatospora purpeofusca TaxID=67352 RepID=UPI00386A8682